MQRRQGGIMEELRTSVMEASKTMHDMRDQFPELVRAISTARGCRVASVCVCVLSDGRAKCSFTK